MNDNQELTDIILNKSGSTNNNKKIILAVATLGVILIIVVMLMNSLTSTGTDNLPQTPTPPQTTHSTQNEALFEEVEILEEEVQNNDNLDLIASRLKEESRKELLEERMAEERMLEEVIVEVKEEEVSVIPIQKIKTVQKVNQKGNQKVYYIQVGSFSKYTPNKKFLKKITNLGYVYKFHKIIHKSKTINKVLIGPFKNVIKAKEARAIIRTKIEPGAFLIQL